MLKKITLLAAITFLLFSCEENQNFIEENNELFNFEVNEQVVNRTLFRNVETACFSTPLIAGQNYEAGRIDVEVVIEEETEYVYITYISNSDWVIKLTHLYAGDRAGIPETKKGNPKPGVFEKKMDYSANVISDFEVEYKIPAEAFDNCFAIAAHAEVEKIDEFGNVVQRETAWGKGEGFEGNSWAMLFEFCQDQCEPTDGDGGVRKR